MHQLQISYRLRRHMRRATAGYTQATEEFFQQKVSTYPASGGVGHDEREAAPQAPRGTLVVLCLREIALT
jgi:hypothetical protein